MVTALMAMRGFDLVAATTLLAEAGDLGRFRTPRQLMAWLGLAPSEASTGERVRRFGITKAGNSRARRVLIESAWCYRHPARVGPAKLARVKAAPAAAQRIAWKAREAACGALSRADEERHIEDRRGDRGCTRADRLRVGDRSRAS